ncbi:MAG: nucleotidyl transferase AbiEii/AbiGii toxin family protein [bacterium]
MEFDRKKHNFILANIIGDIYKNPKINRYLGFKGGTAALMFYNLPRGSVDLDFDLLNESKKEEVFNEIPLILKDYGEILDKSEKRHTLFFLLSYQKGAKKVKVEISKRPAVSEYEVKSYLGIPVIVMRKESMVSNKLCALLTRKKFAARDLFDMWFFLKEGWQFDEKVISDKLNLSVSNALKDAISKVEKVTKNQLLHGLAEFIDEKDKNWIREKLKVELLFQLKLSKETCSKLT